MVDRVKPLKIESSDSGGGDEDDFPTSLNKNEDYIDCRGITIQNDSSNDESVIVSRDASNNMTFTDGIVSGTKTLTELLTGSGGITEDSHRGLDQLVHDITETSYDAITYVSGKVTNLTTWTDSTMTTKIREQQITRSGGRVSSITLIQYDATGTEAVRSVETYTFTNGKPTNTARVRTIA